MPMSPAYRAEVHGLRTTASQGVFRLIFGQISLKSLCLHALLLLILIN